MATKTKTKGMVVSEEEFALVSNVLIVNAQEAEKQGQTQIYAALKRFVVRLKQHVFSGDGVASEVMERLGGKIEQAFANGDYEAARQALVNLLSAIGRSHHDPAHEIAIVLAPMLVHLVRRSAAQQQLSIGAATLRRFHQRVAHERAGFERDGWPGPGPTFDYVRDLSEFCAVELESGLDPFEAPLDPEVPDG